MSQIIANQFATRARLLKGDLSNLGDAMTTVGQDRSVSETMRPPLGKKMTRPPPGLPIPSHLQDKTGRLPISGVIGESVAQLQASIVGCHREAVQRDIPLENCPSSNLHYYVKSIPHSRHEQKGLVPAKTVKRGKIHINMKVTHNVLF